MKRPLSIFLYLLVAGIVAPVHPARSEDAEPFAVVELFTSEGCSSCPPADQLLATIAAENRQKKRRVFVMAFHVDYWNDLGWKDPFSDPSYTQRQQAYTKAFRSSGLYTPQMVVNGLKEFVGSDGGKANSAIEQALSRKAQAAVFLKISALQDAGSYSIAYEVIPVSGDSILNVAWTENGFVKKVTSGENAGRTLRHENVVRAFRTVPLGPEGKGAVEFQVTASGKGSGHVIAYVQNPRTMEILGVSALEIQGSP